MSAYSEKNDTLILGSLCGKVIFYDVSSKFVTN